MAQTPHTSGTGLSPGERLLVRTLGIASCSVVLVSAIYYLWRLPFWLSIVSAVLALVAFGYSVRPLLRQISWRITSPGTAWPYLVVAIVADVIILASSWFFRTDEGIISPWQALPIGVFGLFFLGTFFSLLALRGLPSGWRISLGIFHTWTACAISLLVYQLGFGFDPFVHEAATAHILRFDEILPKQPFYIGQYVTVATLVRLTGISLQTAQAVLVPLLASMILPPLFVTGWHGWTGRDRGEAPLWLLWIIPFAYLTFTVPFNFALIGLIACVLLVSSTDRDARLARIALAAATIAIHPLVGIPAAGLIASHELARYLRGVPLFIASVAASFIGLAGALAFYAAQHGGIIVWPDLETWWATFLVLFRPPFEWVPVAPLWSLLYYGYALWPWTLLLVGLWHLRRSARRKEALVVAGTIAGIFLASLFTAAAISYRDIISHEQYEFALRLLALLPWIAIPGIMMSDLRCQMSDAVLLTSRFCHLTSIALIAIIVTAIWHVSYPQLNPVMHVYAPGVSRTDVLTVEAIERLAEGRSYAALTSQLTAAAALRAFGFTRAIPTVDGSTYPYAIPTGGYLYARYLGLFEGADAKNAIADVFAYATVDQLFIAVPFAWDEGAIDVALTPLSDATEVVDESMRVYRIRNPQTRP